MLWLGLGSNMTWLGLGKDQDLGFCCHKNREIRAWSGNLQGPYCFPNYNFFVPNGHIFHCLNMD